MSAWFSANFHLPDASHLKLSRYHFLSLMLTCPPVARAAPGKRSSPDWDSLIVSSVGVVREGAVYIIFESSTKQYSAKFMESLEIQHLKNAPCPASLRPFIRGVLTISHIVGAALFPCPSTCGGGLRGGAHLSPQYVLPDYPKAVITKYFVF